MIYFTSDLHLGDERLNLYGRDLIANNSTEIDELIIENWNKLVSEKDTVYVLGDVCYNSDKAHLISFMRGRKILIKGNYDEQLTNEEWSRYFDVIYDKGLFLKITSNETVYLNHYPTNGKSDCFNIVGHIHGTWKVQRNMVNVGVDANHFYPVSLDRIKFQINGIRNHYDENVFAGTLKCNQKIL